MANNYWLRVIGGRRDITLTEDNSDRLIGLLRNGQLDLALIGSAGKAASGVDAVVITDEELVAALDSGHPLAGSGAITVGALRDVPLVSLPRGTGTLVGPRSG